MICIRHIRILLLLGFTVLLMSQCSPHAGKSMLHFFFDGVPESDGAALSDSKPPGPRPDTSALTFETLAALEREENMHYPYGEKECAMCHDERSLGDMVEPMPGRCYLCHEDLAGSFNYLHGPVAGGYCTACHDPHRSENDHLLRFTGMDLCFYCHRQSGVLKNEMHQDLEGMKCLDCHNAHGGDDKYIFQ